MEVGDGDLVADGEARVWGRCVMEGQVLKKWATWRWVTQKSVGEAEQQGRGEFP